MDKKICFVSLSSYPLLGGKDMGFVGGAEVQQVFLARELAKRDFTVSFITYSDGQTPIENIEGIKVIKVYKREDLSKLSLLSKAWCVWKALKRANAEIYFHESGAPGIVSIFCRLKRKKLIQHIASDRNVSNKNECKNYKLYHRFANWLDIKLANLVIVQSEFQGRMLKKNFRRESIMIKNAFPLSTHKMPEKVNPPVVLWCATIRNVKQPGLFLKLAESISEARFQMIGGRASDDQRLYDHIEESAKRISNLEFFGFVPFHKTDQYFKQASIFVNTSKFEGFPNTFIQAWLQYVPTISLNANPDGIISKFKLGFHSKTFDQLVEDVKTLLKDEQLRKQMSGNARQYVEREHDISHIVDDYTEVFSRL